MKQSRKIKSFIGSVCVAAMATVGAQSAHASVEKDPWEGFNRKMFVFNDTLDRYLLKPAASGYEKLLPDTVEHRISGVFSNLSEVRNVVNDLLQGKLSQAGNDGGRFLVNTTVGLVGMFDVAQKIGLPKSSGEDFGQTLVSWGVADGPYVVLPFFGPSTVTAALGMPADSAVNLIGQIDHVPTRNTTYGVDLLDTRASLLEAEDLISGDKYTFMRDAYLQRREYLLNDGEVIDSFAAGDDDF